MTTRVMPVAPRTTVGGTVMITGRPAVALQLLPRGWQAARAVGASHV